jgi:hypothetical protein
MGSSLLTLRVLIVSRRDCVKSFACYWFAPVRLTPPGRTISRDSHFSQEITEKDPTSVKGQD